LGANPMRAILMGFAAIIVSWLAGFLFHFLLSRLGFFDKPNDRSSHLIPTVRGGGLGVVAAILLLGSLANWPPSRQFAGFTLSLSLLATVSLWDDWRPISWRIRFGAQAVVAIFFVSEHLRGAGLMMMSSPWALAGVAVVFCLFLVGYANAFNFMDGINGLAAGQAVLTGLGTAAIGIRAGIPMSHPAMTLAIILAGASAGFLPHNFPQARMFMGDVGSVSLGFSLAALAVWLAADCNWALLFPFALLHSNFILDAAITVVRRTRNGAAYHTAHRDHFYQHLARAGQSHVQVTLWESALQTMAIAIIAFLAPMGMPMMGLGGIVVVSLWAAFFIHCERKFRRSRRATLTAG